MGNSCSQPRWNSWNQFRRQLKSIIVIFLSDLFQVNWLYYLICDCIQKTYWAFAFISSPCPLVLHHLWKTTVPIAFWDNVHSNRHNGYLWLAISLREVYGFLFPDYKGALDINGGQEECSLAPSGKTSYHSRFCSTVETQLKDIHLHSLKNTATDSRTAKNKCRWWLYYFFLCDILRTSKFQQKSWVIFSSWCV